MVITIVLLLSPILRLGKIHPEGRAQQEGRAASVALLPRCVWVWNIGNKGATCYVCHLFGLLQQACDEGVSQVRKLSLERFSDSLRSLAWWRNKKKAKRTAGLSGRKARRHSSGTRWMRGCSAGKWLSNWLWINSVEFGAVILSDNYGNSVAMWKYLRHVRGSNGLYKFTYVTVLQKNVYSWAKAEKNIQRVDFIR